MAKYGYIAIDTKGKELKGTLDGDDIDSVKQELKQQGLTVVKISPQSLLTQDINIQIGGKPTARDISIMCHQFVSMIRAGVTILESMRLLAEQTENEKLKNTLKEVYISVQKGESLAASFGKFPKVFPELMVNMTAAGEASGKLETAMERIALQYERSGKTQALIKKAMIYPVMVILIAIVITIVMLVVVIPRYTVMFSDMGTELPFITKLYVAMSDILIQRWFIIVPVVVAVVVLVAYFAKTNTGKHFFGWIALHLPVLKNLVTKSASSMMARTMSTLMGSGVPMIEAVEIVSTIMSNVYYKEALQQAKEDIIIGLPLSRPLETCGLFPPMVYHMVRIGEESGNTEEMLDKLADYYDDEVEIAVQSLMAALEPMIIVVLAVVVGGLIAACMMPMFKLYGALDNL